MSDLIEQPTDLQFVGYQAGNRLLVIADFTTVMEIVSILHVNFKVWCLLPEDTSVAAHQQVLAAGIHMLDSDYLSPLQGHLGNFTVAGHHTSSFDQVLDTRSEPGITCSVLPFGYFVTHGNTEKLQAALVALPEFIGVFDKPRYFKQQLELCAHSSREITGCRLCIDICATAAISSEAGEISIDPYLCQGCGDCASVCPAGAINYQYPQRQAVLQWIKQHFAEHSGVLLLHAGPLELELSDGNEEIVTLQLEALGAAGMDIWLSALAYGAQQVWLLDSDEITTETRNMLIQQIEQALAIVLSLGYSKEVLQFAGYDQFITVTCLPPIIPATFLPLSDKREVIRLAVEHLLQQRQRNLKEPGRPTADDLPIASELPGPAAFGAISVDQDACTLCMACVAICPEQALISTQETPQLKFIESACVQCGICQQACPEQVISLQPRYLLDSKAARTPRVLHEEQPFCCTQCGQAFASRSMIATLLDKLQHHPMYQGEKKRLLTLCEQCKISAMVREET